MVCLGHVLSVEGVFADPEITSKFKGLSIPNKDRDFCSFHGFANYYRKFIKGFASIAKPLHNLIKKNVRNYWSSAQQGSCDQLKLELVTAPFLQYPDHTSSFIVDTDVSKVSIGSMLSNKFIGVD